MAAFEKITGSAITQLFDTLIQHQSLLKLTLMDADYQSLARILGLAILKKTTHFVLDLPEGFERAAADLNTWQIQFEFSGVDHIKYAFTTFGGQIAGQRIYLPLPQELERKQRRELFRLDAPAGTRLCFSKDGNRFELEVMNISIGGSLAAMVQTNANIPENSPFAVDRVLKDVALVFPTEIMRRPIEIEAVEVKRIKRDPETQRYEVGFEFCKINTDEQKHLTDLIYELQRQYLRQRIPLDI
jgi:c-di-GMP-binding flagellar brake protein YcgR